MKKPPVVFLVMFSVVISFSLFAQDGTEMGSFAGSSDLTPDILAKEVVSQSAVGSFSTGAPGSISANATTHKVPAQDEINKGEVSYSGTFSYRYPIQAPSGTNGMAPSIALAYNSASGNGLAGVGFVLSGLSVIERDASYPVLLNASDHYILDGEKLFKNADSSYHTEREDFSRIFTYSSTGQKIDDPNSSGAYWVVEKKDGTKWFYGSTPDSRIIALKKKNGPQYNYARLWALSKVEDSLGNYFSVSYEEDATNGDYYPSRIVYTKNDVQTLNAYNVIEFSYEPRPDVYPRYAPTFLEENLRLKWITVRVGASADGSGGALLRK